MEAIYHLTLNSGHTDIVPRQSVESRTIEDYRRGMDAAVFQLHPPRSLYYPTASGVTEFKTSLLPPLTAIHAEHSSWSSASVMCDGVLLLRLVTAWGDKTAALHSLRETRHCLERQSGAQLPHISPAAQLNIPLSAMLLLPSPDEWKPIYAFLGRAVDALSFAHLIRWRGRLLDSVIGRYWRN